MSHIKHKDPAAVLDFVFDWRALANGTGTSNWLDSTSPQETISSHSVTVSPATSPGLTIDSDQRINSNSAVQVVLSGGELGVTYTLTCQVVTDAAIPRTDERSMRILIRNR